MDIVDTNDNSSVDNITYTTMASSMKRECKKDSPITRTAPHRTFKKCIICILLHSIILKNINLSIPYRTLFLIKNLVTGIDRMEIIPYTERAYRRVKLCAGKKTLYSMIFL